MWLMESGVMCEGADLEEKSNLDNCFRITTKRVPMCHLCVTARRSDVAVVASRWQPCTLCDRPKSILTL